MIEHNQAELSHTDALVDNQNKHRFLDVSYAAVSSSQRLDIYCPEKGAGSYPCIVHIHGGAFREGDKADGQLQPWLSGMKRGYVVASINYRMSGEAAFPAAVQDCKAAIRFLRANAAAYHIDPARIGVVGGSAGGYFTVMMCVTDPESFPEDVSLGWGTQSSKVNCGIAWFPPTDFLQMDVQLADNGLFPRDHHKVHSPESDFMGGQIGKLDPERMAKSNPLNYVGGHTAPLYLQHGRLDHVVPYQQSVILAEKMKAVGKQETITCEIMEGADHADAVFAAPENMEKMFRFLDHQLNKTE